jgi:ribosomal protein L5
MATAKAAKNVDTSARLKRQYTETFRAELVKELGLKSLSEAPKITKIVVNVDMGKATILRPR